MSVSDSFVSDFSQQPSRPDLKTLAQQVIDFWKSDKTFEASIEQRPANNPYRFYDGPPFVTGMPHYGSLLSGICKDVIPRYHTMKGKRVERVWGWDCHGLPIEQKVQKKFGLEKNDEIEDFGIQKFINECYHYTHSTSAQRQWYVDQSGRRVDLHNSYKTMDNDYMESVLWVFKQLWNKSLIYQGKRVSLYSTKLSTPISNFEVAMDDTYEEVNDPAITVAFDLSENGGDWEGVSVLAWTTTPWTIPLNIALGVHQDNDYALVAHEGKTYVVASARVESVFAGKEHEVVKEITGADLVGLSYQPPYDLFKGHTNNDADHKIYHADFITDTDGTGIGHQAPEFGDVDFQLAQEKGMTITEGMDKAGYYTDQLGDKAGVFYRDANEPIMAELAEKGMLFAKGSITHRVAFCPRSHTPLVYKAQESWFIDVKSLKPKLLKHNRSINWFPEYFKNGRFAKSIENAPDWCISRTRYRGTPMPVYRNIEDEKDIQVIGSRQELFTLNKPHKQLIKIILVRHGRTDYNAHPDGSLHDHEGKARLTSLGEKQAELFAAKFADEKIDAVYSSPLQRCLDTLDPIITAKNIAITTDDRIKEVYHPDFQDKAFQCSMMKRGAQPIGGGETVEQVYERVEEFMEELIDKHAGQTVVVCAHGDPLVLMRKVLKDYDYNTDKDRWYISNREWKDIRREEYVVVETKNRLDLHRPVIDAIKLSVNGADYVRTPEVLDVWMDSASMPYAQLHYPFSNKDTFERSFPADYVVEYTGQIRAWFYVMHVLGVALFDRPAFTNVVTTGVLAGNDGRKMSKSYGNYPDTKQAFEQYGGDAIRMNMINSPVVAGGDMAISEEGFAESLRKNVLPLWNSFTFFTTYASIDGLQRSDLDVTLEIIKEYDFLDRWIVAELHRMIADVDTYLAGYDMQKASGSLTDFFDLLTNRYIRRSRRRFWKTENDGDKRNAYRTLYYVLVELSKTAAPFMPIVSEYIYQELTGQRSVHLADFPVSRDDCVDQSLLDSMSQVQKVVSAGLARRANKKIRVRQPLACATVGVQLDEQYQAIIADELNVKAIVCDTALNDTVKKICKPDARQLGPQYGKDVQHIIKQAKSGDFTENTDGSVSVGEWTLQPGEYEITYIKADETLDVEVVDGIVVSLDADITDELALEWYTRDFIRFVQEARKTAGYELSDRIALWIDDQDATDGFSVARMIEWFGDYIQAETLSTIHTVVDDLDHEETVKLGEYEVRFGLKRG